MKQGRGRFEVLDTVNMHTGIDSIKVYPDIVMKDIPYGYGCMDHESVTLDEIDDLIKMVSEMKEGLLRVKSAMETAARI